MPPVAETDRRRNIGVFTQPTAMTQDRPCSDQIEPGVGRTVDDLVAWLGTVNGLVATAPTPITIDGHPGQWLDLRRNPTWTKTCEGSDETLVTFLNPGIAVGDDLNIGHVQIERLRTRKSKFPARTAERIERDVGYAEPRTRTVRVFPGKTRDD